MSRKRIDLGKVPAARKALLVAFRLENELLKRIDVYAKAARRREARSEASLARMRFGS